jgi:hypothetical protein
MIWRKGFVGKNRRFPVSRKSPGGFYPQTTDSSSLDAVPVTQTIDRTLHVVAFVGEEHGRFHGVLVIDRTSPAPAARISSADHGHLA